MKRISSSLVLCGALLGLCFPIMVFGWGPMPGPRPMPFWGGGCPMCGYYTFGMPFGMYGGYGGISPIIPEPSFNYTTIQQAPQQQPTIIIIQDRPAGNQDNKVYKPYPGNDKDFRDYNSK